MKESSFTKSHSHAETFFGEVSAQVCLVCLFLRHGSSTRHYTFSVERIKRSAPPWACSLSASVSPSVFHSQGGAERERESRAEDIGDAQRGSGGCCVFLGFFRWSILNSQLLINQTNPDIQHEYCASTDAVRRLGYVLCETQSRCKNKSTKKNMMKKHWFKKRNGGSHEPI